MSEHKRSQINRINLANSIDIQNKKCKIFHKKLSTYTLKQKGKFVAICILFYIITILI